MWIIFYEKKEHNVEKNILVYINKVYKNYKKYKNNQYDILANIKTICNVWLF